MVTLSLSEESEGLVLLIRDPVKTNSWVVLGLVVTMI